MGENPSCCSARFYLGALLFNVFICDLFSIMNNINFASYADDNTPYIIDH